MCEGTGTQRARSVSNITVVCYASHTLLQILTQATMLLRRSAPVGATRHLRLRQHHRIQLLQSSAASMSDCQARVPLSAA